MPLINDNNLQQALAEFKDKLSVAPIYVDPMDVKDKHTVEYHTMRLSENITLASNNSTTPVKVRFNTLSVTTDGTKVNTSNNTIHLTAKKTYRISVSLGLYSAARTMYAVFRADTNTPISDGAVASGSNNSEGYSDSHLYSIYTPDVDMDVYVGATWTIASTVLHSGFSYFTVEEIAQPVVVEYNKEISNPLTTTDISYEHPVGSFIGYAGKSAPNHYLICDGKTYNIIDYPELAQHFLEQYGMYNYFGGDGILNFAVPLKNIIHQSIDQTPVMTSNTTPSPYVVSASSDYGSPYAPWKVFDGTDNLSSSSAWFTKGTSAGWIMIKLSKKTPVSYITITARNYSDSATYSPKSFNIEGSNDGVTFYVLKSITDETGWVANQTRKYMLDSTVIYQYYRINVFSSNGNLTTIGKIKLYHETSTEFTCIKAEHSYYAANQYGGFQQETLWTGELSTISSPVTLSDSVNNYSHIYVTSVCDTETSTSVYSKTEPIIVENIELSKNSGLANNFFKNPTNYYNIAYEFVDNTTFQINEIDNAGFLNPRITKIVGVYGQLPSLLTGGVF